MTFLPLELLDSAEEIDAKAAPQWKTCNRCGARGLHWEETADGWKLFTKDSRHKCKRSPDTTAKGD